MKRILVAAILVLSACAPAPPAADDREATVALLAAQADAWDKSIVRKDRAAIEANMAEDFRQIDGAGNVETRASFVDGLMSEDLVIDPYTVEDFDVRLYGDVALLSGRTDMTGKFRGKPFRSHYRYIDIYVRKDGEWKIVSVQITPVAAAGSGAADVIPLRTGGGFELAAALTLGGREALFMFDTGAGVNTLADWFVREAGIPADAALGKAVSATDSTGKPIAVKVAAAQSAALPGGGTLALQPAAIAAFPPMFEESRIGGLVNPQLLADAQRAVVLDLRVPELRLEPFDAAVRRLKATTFPPTEFRACRDASTPVPNLLFEVRVSSGGGRVGRLQLDSGADRSSIVAASPLVRGLTLAPGGETMGIGGERVRHRQAPGLPLAVGPYRTVIDATVLESGHGGDCGADGLLGRDALGGCALVFAPDRLAIACDETPR